MCVVWRRDMRITAEDRVWRKAIGHYVRNEDAGVPPAGRFNYGQKMLFWLMAWGGVALLLSGLVMWFVASVPWDLRIVAPAGDARPRDCGASHNRRLHRSCLHGRCRRARRAERGHSRRRQRGVGQTSSSAMGPGKQKRERRWKRRKRWKQCPAQIGTPSGPAATTFAKATAGPQRGSRAGDPGGPPKLYAEAEGTSRWDERIARARELAAEYSSAAEILTFYAALAEYQRSLCRRRVRSTSCDVRLRPNGRPRRRIRGRPGPSRVAAGDGTGTACQGGGRRRAGWSVRSGVN